MLKPINAIKFTLIAVTFIFPLGKNYVKAAEEFSGSTVPSSAFSPSGLSARERSALDRQYQYEVRNKGMLLTPRASKIEAVEEEKLYRYFGVAAGLRKNGRFEEAVEILEYILDKNPADDYVRAYLKSAQEEMEAQKTKWKIENEKDASRLKEKETKDLTTDGIAYYERGDFDTALLKFSDVLSLDGNNQTAKEYMEKLKKYYFKEIKMERLTEGWSEEKEAAANLPDKSKEDMKYVALERRVDKLLNDAELDFRIEKTIASMKEEERRSHEFTLGPGDVVKVGVLDHPELSGQVALRLKGEITLPLVNEVVMAGGLTMDELTVKVKEAMKRYVQDPTVNVSIVEYKSKVFYVVDEISCTPFPITSANLTLRDALFISDWGDNRALGRVIVMKPSKREPIVKKVDAFDLIYRGNLKNDIKIDDGDVIYVPMTFAAKVTKAIADALGPFRAVRTARDHYLNLKWNEKDWKDSTRIPKTYEFQSEDGEDVRFDNDLNLQNVIIRR